MQKPLMDVSYYLPPTIRPIIESIARSDPFPIQEIRLRVNQPLAIVAGGQNLFVTKQGEITVSPSVGQKITGNDIKHIFMCACQNSVYAYNKELQNGYITLSGGHRMGLAGRIVYENNSIHTIRDLSSLSIRIAGEKKGCSHALLPYLINNKSIRSCAIISPPGGGKTTVLRDIARNISLQGHRVCVIDERGEIAGCHQGNVGYDLGPSCDVLDRCDKTDGLQWALRCLSPSVMIVDELGSNREAQAVLQGISGGVGTIFSLHAANMQQALQRSPMLLLMRQRVPELCVMLGSSQTPGKIVHIYDFSRKEDALLVQSIWNSSA